MATAAALLTAEEYARLPDRPRLSELVRGEVVVLNMPYPRHGQICTKTILFLGKYNEVHDLGHIVSNDSGVITERDPDTVRGPDVAFYSYERVPKGPFPRGYLPVVPNLAFEIRSPGDTWREIHTKVAEFLNAGVTAVCVLDEQTEAAHLYYAEQTPRIIAANEELTIPEVLPDFRVPVRRFFE